MVMRSTEAQHLHFNILADSTSVSNTHLSSSPVVMQEPHFFRAFCLVPFFVFNTTKSGNKVVVRGHSGSSAVPRIRPGPCSMC
jgi:hypothetical protein